MLKTTWYIIGVAMSFCAFMAEVNGLHDVFKKFAWLLLAWSIATIVYFRHGKTKAE